MGAREYARGRRVVARLSHGGDLLEEIAAVADAHGMEAAELRAIGALQRARLAFYDQTTHEYGEFAVDGRSSSSACSATSRGATARRPCTRTRRSPTTTGPASAGTWRPGASSSPAS